MNNELKSIRDISKILPTCPSIKDIVFAQPMVAEIPPGCFSINFPSEEEKVKMDKMVKDMNIVRTAIREKHPRGTEFIQDIIPCPICKDGIVSFIISDHYNGHIHAKCSKGCVDWME